MAFREVRVFEVREVLRLWLRGEGLRAAERLAGVAGKTVHRYVDAALEAGPARDGGVEPGVRRVRSGERVRGRPGPGALPAGQGFVFTLHLLVLVR